jgi:hypothetical protein
MIKQEVFFFFLWAPLVTCEYKFVDVVSRKLVQLNILVGECHSAYNRVKSTFLLFFLWGKKLNSDSHLEKNKIILMICKVVATQYH